MANAIKYVFAKDVKELEKLQAKAIKSVQSARVAVQIAAVATIRHAYEHGDWTYAQTLVDGVSGAANAHSLVEWFKKYGGLQADDNGFIGWNGKDHIKNNFEEAKATMWWEAKGSNPFKGYNLEGALQNVLKQHVSMMKKIDKLSDEDKGKVNLQVNDETIQAVLKLCNFEAIIEQDEDKAA